METLERPSRLESPGSPTPRPTPLLPEAGFEPSFERMAPRRCGHCSGFHGTPNGQGLHALFHVNTPSSRLLLLAVGAGLLTGLIFGFFLDRGSVKGGLLGAFWGTALGFAAGHITLCVRKRQAAHPEPSLQLQEADQSQHVVLSTAVDNESFLSAMRMPGRGHDRGTSGLSEELVLQSVLAGAGRWQRTAEQHATNSAAIRTALLQHLTAHRNGRFQDSLELQDDAQEEATDHQFALQQQHAAAMMRNTAWRQLSTREQRLAHRLERAQEERDIRLAQALSLQASMNEPPRVRPADPFLVEALPLRRVAATDLAQMPDESRSCTICLEEFRTGDQQRTLPCFHRFHKTCVDQWLRQDNTCPLCKHSLEAAVSLAESSA